MLIAIISLFSLYATFLKSMKNPCSFNVALMFSSSSSVVVFVIVMEICFSQLQMETKFVSFSVFGLKESSEPTQTKAPDKINSLWIILLILAFILFQN